MGLRTLLRFSCLLIFFIASHAQPGFISIDCGLQGEANYTDSRTGIVYSPDAGFVDSGLTMNVSSRPATSSMDSRYMTMRSFPNGTRNCYTISPINAGGKYLIRAGFFYGNYDGRDKPPAFDLYLGVNMWKRVETLSEVTVFAEIIFLSSFGDGAGLSSKYGFRNAIHICVGDQASSPDHV